MKIDSSQLQTYLSCPQKYYFKYVLNLKKRKYDERDVDLEFGQRVHKCLEWYKKFNDADFVKHWIDFEDLPEEIELCKTRANGLKMSEEFIQHLEKIDKGIETLSVEDVGEVKLSDDITWIVKIDRVVKKDENIYFNDYKTKGKSLPYNYFSRFSPNLQVSGYCFYVQEKYGQCSGGIIDVLMSGFRKKKYLDSPPGFHCEFKREIVNRTPEQLEDFRNNAIFWCHRLEEDLGDLKIGKNEGACWQYRGCPYIALCLTSQGIKIDEEIAETMYEKTNPKAYLKKSQNQPNPPKTGGENEDGNEDGIQAND